MKKCFLAALVVLGALLPAAGICQPPALLAVWGAPNSGQFSHPNGVTVDRGGLVYVADGVNQVIQVWTAAGAFLTQFGGRDTLFFPSKVAVGTDGSVYVADGSAGLTPVWASGITIWRDGVLQRRFGSWGSGPGQLYECWGVAVHGNRLYVADSYNYRIAVFTTEGDYVTEWPTGDFCQGIALDDSDHVYVTEYSGRLDVFSTDGVHVRTIGTPGNGVGQLNKPYDVALDKHGHVYVADSYNERVEVFTTGGAYVVSWGGHGSEPGHFIQPRGLAVDANGLVYVADTWNNRIQVFGSVPTPATTTTWGRIKALYR
jgi:tripartite motif-containing protein 71